MNTIHHITQRLAWENAKLAGSYRADSLKTEGFIHCSRRSQLIKTANKFFKNQTNLVLLYIDQNKVQAEIKYEPADNDLFPHIYGELNVDAVYQVIDFEADTTGLFHLPENL
ncbi:DUF952 domain-containing protein [Calothrix sp. UHCC 0171]|uniref:DUF952 domain-containing protein n=1 Tax=Calothrix sp. UHCC 0171 TaxID=3110245 RepID=UPI002B209B5B|nr:DUF952 domain-containing protein [Calothrix sp. UHCC 0171]MEA5569611.1 DUF952 domain-containing protein [Calothrix sp. UHCC 0171]